MKTDPGSKKQKAARSSANARRSAARLAAVQAVYQMTGNNQTARTVIEEFIATRLGQPVDGEEMVLPDGTLFSEIVTGVEERYGDLKTLVDAARSKQRNSGERTGNEASEPLLDAVLFCGSWELLAKTATDTPVIISDYMHVAHAFFAGGEPKLVNAILDHVGRAVRDRG